MERLRESYESSIVDLTVQNYSAQNSGNDALKQKVIALKDEIKTYVAQMQIACLSCSRLRFAFVCT
jgi:hypothetical protein